MKDIVKWAQLTPSQQKDFLLDGKVELKHQLINEQGNKNTKLKGYYSKDVVTAMLHKIKKKGVSYYGSTDTELYKALDKFPVKNKTVGILGSTQPWYDAIVLHYGGKPVTIEYNQLKTNDERLQLLTVDEYEQNPIKFDVIFSISSFEHDGLGRYGDPINPIGDVKAMDKVKGMLKENGLLFLAVPIGKDQLFWNAHRIYGKHRFWKLIEGWEILYSGSFTPKKLKSVNGIYQPIFILKPKK